ncbi:MAG: DUF1800 domain-containing protein [Burkholderiales bacterium]|nr:DUF1800 domain-containing protein [Burkholderiales bacterium]
MPSLHRIAVGFIALATASAAFAQTASQAVYRFYNHETGTHFYTVSLTERDSVIQQFPQFAYEGGAFAAVAQSQAGAVPVFRFYNTKTGTHFYTTSASERDGIVAYYPQFAYEGTAYYALGSDGADGRVPVFRFFNGKTGAHFYTASAAERDKVLASYPNLVYEGTAYYVYPAASATVAPVVVRASDAFRLLQQATFGPTPAALARAQELGAANWVEEQFAQPMSGYPDAEYYYLSLDESSACSFGASRSSAQYVCARDQLTLFKLRNQFFTNALYKPDQLRQRVAWALSQFFVVSGMKDPDMETAYVQARWHQILFEEAFGDFGRLLWRVTLSPQMGHYLDLVNNAKANPQKGTEPNENFARELLQLFTIGTVELESDGTPVLDAKGQPVPTYGQADVKAIARALTGWAYPPYDAAQTKGPSDKRYYARNMVAVESRHDTGSKTLLEGVVAPAGQSAAADLDLVVANLFLHPNVGPFFAQHMIRQLVTGNPSPAYVKRVAAAFNDNGGGKRGDMKAVVRAVLLDPEARGDVKTASNYGMLREPVLFITAFLRGVDGASDGNRLYEPARAMGQDVYYAPSVFNYYPADYRIPGTTLTAPQFGIHNTNTVLHRANFVYEMLDGGGWSPDSELAGAVGTKVDINPFRNVAASPRDLVNLVNARLFGGGMPLGLRDEIYKAVAALPAGSRSERSRAALFLALTSFQFQVMR